MKHSLADKTPLAWAGWLCLGIVLAGTITAWFLSRAESAQSISIEPLPPQTIEVLAPDSMAKPPEEEQQQGEAGETPQPAVEAEVQTQ